MELCTQKAVGPELQLIILSTEGTSRWKGPELGLEKKECKRLHSWHILYIPGVRRVLPQNTIPALCRGRDPTSHARKLSLTRCELSAESSTGESRTQVPASSARETLTGQENRAEEAQRLESAGGSGDGRGNRFALAKARRAVG